MTTGIAPTRLILDKSLEYKEGSMVTVNWEGKKIRAEIVALDGKCYNLTVILRSNKDSVQPFLHE